MSLDKKTICIVGGTGAEGSGLAARWAAHGHRVIIGSRDASKARSTVDAINALTGKKNVEGMESRAGVQQADVVVLTVPFSAQRSTVESLKDVLAGKVLIDVTVPLVPPKVSTVQLPESDSCVVAVQKFLGEQTKVVSAFQNVSAHKLKDLNYEIECDVLVASDDVNARQVGLSLAGDAGLKGIDVGPLANSVVAESLTSVLIWINRKYKIPDAGIKITGVGGE
ncbi:MAG: NADPH-dependent F420 reductase [Xanthobacteraceae bacterium]|nr:NADPH-dependent F420 reductase [Xanthobacteraceae bacterium]